MRLPCRPVCLLPQQFCPMMIEVCRLTIQNAVQCVWALSKLFEAKQCGCGNLYKTVHVKKFGWNWTSIRHSISSVTVMKFVINFTASIPKLVNKLCVRYYLCGCCFLFFFCMAHQLHEELVAQLWAFFGRKKSSLNQNQSCCNDD